jgi:hypothetical protein
MQVVLVGAWLLMMGMMDAAWYGGMDQDVSVPASESTEVVAAEGPVNPPKP